DPALPGFSAGCQRSGDDPVRNVRATRQSACPAPHRVCPTSSGRRDWVGADKAGL
ncbi:MAG: hypothetical protein AVDCRST_MAG23-1516, partial [uncultured Sphingosinicella sp.]